MSVKYFPIKTETACRLKWSWSTIYLTTGISGSCHRASYGQLNQNNFDNIDQRRNLNWKKTFPWLEQQVKHVV